MSSQTRPPTFPHCEDSQDDDRDRSDTDYDKDAGNSTLVSEEAIRGSKPTVSHRHYDSSEVCGDSLVLTAAVSR